MRKILEVTLVAIATLIAIVPLVAPQSATVNADAAVTSTCDVQASPGSISFGSLTPGDTKDGTTQDVVVSQILGNNPAILSVSGSDWTNSGSTMPVGQTHWNTTSSVYASETALTSGLATVDASLAGTGSDTVHFGLMIPAHQAAAAYTQTITFTVSCG